MEFLSQTFIDKLVELERLQELLQNWSTTTVATNMAAQNASTIATDFSNTQARFALVGNECGEVVMIDADKVYQESSAQEPTLDLHQYSDAIFDISWSPSDAKYALAVADNHIYVHDSQTHQVLNCLGSHSSSVRTTKFKSKNENILASAGRDGNILIWDLRTCATNSILNRPVSVLHSAHSTTPNKRLSLGGGGGARKRSSLKGTASSSVTAILMMPLQDHLMASIGQPDYDIRFWDLRYNVNVKKTASPCASIPAPQLGRRSRSFINICTDSVGSKIYATSSDNHIYSFLSANFHAQPLQTFSAPTFRTSGSFYIKSTLSPDDRYLLSGSVDNCPFIWPLLGKQKAPSTVCKLSEHRYEVSCVGWSKMAGPEQYIFVGGEDYVSRVWRRREGSGILIEGSRRHQRMSVEKLPVPHRPLPPNPPKPKEPTNFLPLHLNKENIPISEYPNHHPFITEPPTHQISKTPSFTSFASSITNTPSKRSRQSVLDSFLQIRDPSDP